MFMDLDTEATNARVEEMEEEAEKLKQMQSGVKQMTLGSVTAAAAIPLLVEEIKEIDDRSIEVENVDKGATAEELMQSGVEQPSGSATAAAEPWWRVLEVENCIRKQKELCGAMREPSKVLPLSLKPLASESEVAAFREHLNVLEGEYVDRSEDIEYLKMEISWYCMELGIPIKESIRER